MAKQDVRVELFHSGVWNPVTDRVFVEDGITVTRGKGGEGQQLKPSTAKLTLDNRDGRFSPRNPRSPLFGRIGRNTPLRIGMGEPHVGATNFSVADTTDHVAPSVVAPTDEGLLLCAWAAPQNDTWTLPPGMTAGSSQINTQSIQTAFEDITTSGPTGTRTATFDVVEDYMAASVLLHGTGLTVVESEGDSNGLLLLNAGTLPGDWVVLFSSWWSDVGETTTANPDVLTDIPDYPVSDHHDGWLLLGDTGVVSIGDAEAGAMRLKVWALQVKVPPEQDLAAQHAVQFDFGDYVARSVMHVVRGAADWQLRFQGEVASWPPMWDIRGRKVRTPVQAAGITRRIGRAQTTLHDAVRRFADDRSAAGYWPLSDPRGSNRAEAIAGSNLRVVTNADDLVLENGKAPLFGEGATYPWLPVALRTTDAGALRGAMEGTPGGWSWDLVFAMRPADFGVNQSSEVTFSWVIYDIGLLWEFQLRHNSSTGDNEIQLFVIERDTSSVVASDTFATTRLFDGQPHVLRGQMTDSSGNDVSVQCFVDGESIGGSGNFGIGQATPDAVTFVTAVWRAHIDARVDIGQAIVWNADGPSATEAFAAILGHQGERPSVRFDRLLPEERIARAVVVGDTESHPTTVGRQEEVLLGPQFPGKLVDILREIGTTGQGWEYESRQFRGYVYRTVGAAYNRQPVLELDYAAQEVAPPLHPVEDDQRSINDVSAKRRAGGEVRRVRTSGPLNVNDPADDPDGIGRIDTTITVNVADDANLLENQAGWRLHLGTVDEPRYPRITVDLDATPELAAAAGWVDVGDRITIVNPPEWLPPEAISQLVLGYIETIESHRRKITFNCTPESPYHIAEVEHPLYATIGPDGSTVESAFDAGSETILEVAVAEGFPPWVHEVDFDIFTFGVRLTVTAVGALSPARVQQLTVTQAPVNGITKTIPAGERVDLFHKSYIGL